MGRPLELTTKEAAAYVQAKTLRAFYAWKRRHGIPWRAPFGRIRQSDLDRALARRRARGRAAFTLVLTLALAAPVAAEGLRWPAAAYLAAQAADLATTHAALGAGAGRETNPLLAGSDATRIAIKAATTAGVLVLARRLDRDHPRASRILLYSLAGVTTGIAVHNAQIARGRP